MCPRSIYSLLKSDEIQELMEQIQKEFEDRVSIQEFLKYVERQEALNQGIIEDDAKDKVGDTLPSVSMAKEWADGLKEQVQISDLLLISGES